MFSKRNPNFGLLSNYTGYFDFSAQTPDDGNFPKRNDLFRRVAETVDDLIHEIFPILILHIGKTTIQFQFIAWIVNITIRNVSVNINFQYRIWLRFSQWLTALHLDNGFFQQVTICGETYAGNMTMLLCAKQITGAADFQVTHSNTEASTQFREIFNGLQSFFRNFTQSLIPFIDKIGIGKTGRTANPAPHLIELG